MVGQHIDEGGFSHVASSDESVFGQVALRTFPYVRITNDEFCAFNVHVLYEFGVDEWR